jgi:hypothetical protein
MFTFFVYSYSATPRVLLHHATVSTNGPTAALAHGRSLLAEWKHYGLVSVTVVNSDGEVIYHLVNE